MPDRWTAWWRRRVPEPARTLAFDPALADLQRAWRHRPARRFEPARRRCEIVRLVLQCRRLRWTADADRERRSVIEVLMLWSPVLRVALRRLRGQPLFTVSAIVTLAVGIGANLAVGAYVYGFLLSPVNAPDAGQLVRVAATSAGSDPEAIVSWPVYQDARDGLRGVDLAAHAFATAQIGGGEGSELRPVELVSGYYFRVLSQVPLAGRLLGEADNVAELAHPVVVLNEAYWRSRFGADPRVVGAALVVNGTPFEVVGVAAPGFGGTYRAHPVDLWAPIMMQQIVRPRGLTVDRRTWGWLQIIGRRGADVTIDLTAQQLAAVAADLDRRFPPGAGRAGAGFHVSDAAALSAGDEALLAPVLAVTLSFTALLFVVTCANLAGVMQARLLARRRELAVRQALGGSRGRVLAEWLVECLALAGAGGLLGLIAARGLLVVVSGLRPPEQLLGNLSLATAFDARVWVSALVLTLLAALIFGVLPAWSAARRPPGAGLRDDARTATGGRAAVRLRRAAVVVQLAASGLLLLCGALLARSLANQQAFDPGFDTARLGLLSIDLARQRVPQADRRALAEAALDRLRRDPDVRHAAYATHVPLGFGQDVFGFRIPGHTPPDDRNVVPIDVGLVSANYFAVLGVPFVAGRAWPADLPADAAPVVVVNETMAARFWAGANPVGDVIEIGSNQPVRIAGVVRDVAYYEVGGDPLPFVYLPAELRVPGAFTLVVRTADDPAPVLGRLAQGLEGVDRRLSPHEALTFEALRRVPLFPARVLAGASWAFGVMAIVLAGVGLYGLVSMSVGSRTREIGVRMTLGAQPDAVLRAVLGEAAALALAGIGIALAGGVLIASLLEAWLFEVSPFDPLSSGLVAVVLFGLALVAAWHPAHRAARVDPSVVLRELA